MIIEIKIPSPGESISEVELASWFVENGDTVLKDQEIGEVESEKATLPLIAEQSGKVELIAAVGDTIKVGAVACKIDTSVKADPSASSSTGSPYHSGTGKGAVLRQAQEPGGAEKSAEKSTEKSAVLRQAQEPRGAEGSIKTEHKSDSKNLNEVKITPVARKMMDEAGLHVEDIINGLRKITSADINAIKRSSSQASGQNYSKQELSRDVKKTPISQLRKKISQRLVAVKNETAMLTTFNEADMSAVIALRKKYQDKFVEKHGVKLGFMSFFTKAVTIALGRYPNVNSYLDGNEIISPDYCDIGIAVQTEKGLMVPIIRNTETLGLADIEKQILDIAARAKKNRISMDELSDGTFTITNGGTFGSMLSTPILNPPQSAILGMHNIIERPVAVNGKVEIRPMMYLALSYDHRLIDGKDSVGFLKTVKEYIENPAEMLFAGSNTDQILLNI